ncbi:MAG: asparagine synthase-related protein [Thermodesulfobacteriota bacterium]|nr:MAG: asparagine synthase-related protein [Thermodesulfobacteriota bacterium]
MLETSLHLYQPAQYARSPEEWSTDFSKVIHKGEQKLSLDVSAILSILAFNYPCGDRTLFQELKRQPWLSSITQDGRVVLKPIPPHGFAWDSSGKIAAQLNILLQEEAERACYNREEIYVLLSGGLDSRIVAGILYQLKQKGILKRNPIGLTWGLENSRDVQYAKVAAEMLGFGWKHIAMGPETIIENIYEGFPLTAGLVPPAHLHRMLWFKKNVSKKALVLAGSYGDSVGRAEFSGRQILELDFLKPFDPYNLIKQDFLAPAISGIQKDLILLHERAGQNSPKHALCEIEMQGHYMRGMIAHVMAVINNWCTLYQMFTDPKVYTYMWSLHPARRDDSIYAALLESIHPGLVRIPWARTNKALRGRTIGKQNKLRRKFHDYAMWSSHSLYDEISKIVEPEWFESLGIFNPAQVQLLNKAVASGGKLLKGYGFQLYNVWHWLAGFRKMIENLRSQGFAVHPVEQNLPITSAPPYLSQDRSFIYRKLSNIKLLYKIYSFYRKRSTKYKAIKKWPINN